MRRYVLILGTVLIAVIAVGYPRLAQVMRGSGDIADLDLALSYCAHAVSERDLDVRPRPSGLIRTDTGNRAWEVDDTYILVGDSYQDTWQCTLQSPDPAGALVAADRLLNAALVLTETRTPWANGRSERIVAEICHMGRRLSVNANVTFAELSGDGSISIRDVPGAEGDCV